MLRAYGHQIHVHKTPLSFPFLQKPKIQETYYQHPSNGMILPGGDLIHVLTRRITPESVYTMLYVKLFLVKTQRLYKMHVPASLSTHNLTYRNKVLLLDTCVFRLIFPYRGVESPHVDRHALLIRHLTARLVVTLRVLQGVVVQNLRQNFLFYVQNKNLMEKVVVKN